MHTLKNWYAKRAGGRMTIYGVDTVTNDRTKIVGVDMLEPGYQDGKPVCFAIINHRLPMESHVLSINA